MKVADGVCVIVRVCEMERVEVLVRVESAVTVAVVDAVRVCVAGDAVGDAVTRVAVAVAVGVAVADTAATVGSRIATRKSRKWRAALSRSAPLTRTIPSRVQAARLSRLDARALIACVRGRRRFCKAAGVGIMMTSRTC